MPRRPALLLLSFRLLLPATLVATPMTLAQSHSLVYPAAHTVDQTDDYFGTKVADPYRWMEDVDSPEVKTWVDAENTLTHGYLDPIPARAAIRDRILHLNSFERYTLPVRRGTRYFYAHNEGLQNQNVVFWQEGLNGAPHVLIDPNTLRADGTVALNGMEVTDDGTLAAYAISDAGSDWLTWHVREVATGKDLPDAIQWSKFSNASWTHDNSGFFYSAYEAPDDAHKAEFLKSTNYFHKLYFHKLGTPQSEDKLVFDRPDDKELNIGGSVTDDGSYLIIYQSKGTSPNNELAIKDLAHPDQPILRLVTKADATYSVIDNDGSFFWLQTTLDAPNGKVIGIDLAQPDRAHWKTVIPETKNALDSVHMVDNQLIAAYLADAQSRVELHTRDGALTQTLTLPAIGTTDGFTGRRTDTETFYTFTNFTTPATIYRLDLKTKASSVYRQPKLLFNPADFETRQVFATSKDGTRVPIFLSYRKGLKIDGTAPTLLYAYGGFNISMVPVFAPSRVVWMEMGGIFAQAVSARRRRVRRVLAPSRHRGPQAERLRRLHRLRRIPHREQVHLNAEACDPGREQWRPARRCSRVAAPRPLRGRPGRRRRDGHAALRQVHHRLGVEAGLRRALRRQSRLRGHLQIFAAAQHPPRRGLSTDPHHHRRPRRPRLPGPQLQVRRDHASGHLPQARCSCLTRRAHSDSHRNPCRPW